MVALAGNPHTQIGQISIFQLCGYSPTVINQIAETARQFWDNQREIQYNYLKRAHLKNHRALKEEKAKNQANELKHQNEINKVTQKSTKLVAVAKNYKQKAIKLQNNLKKVQNALNERNRQFKNVNNKYTDLLRRKNRNSPNRSSNRSQGGSVHSGTSSSGKRSRRNSGNNHQLVLANSIVPETVVDRDNPLPMTRYHDEPPQKRQKTGHGHSNYQITQYHPQSQQPPYQQTAQRQHHHQRRHSQPPQLTHHHRQRQQQQSSTDLLIYIFC